MAKIFISHSVADKPLVDSFVDLLQTGANYISSDIFCSSLEGMGIPTGMNFIEFIKNQLKSPEAVIVILSKNYLNSQFCQCELGASWMLSSYVLPLLVAPITFNDVKGVLTGTQAAHIHDSNELNIFIDSLNKKLGNESFSFPRWEVKRDSYLEGYGTLYAQLPLPATVTQQEFQDLKKNYESAKSQIKQLMLELEDEKQLSTEISKLKDKDAVTDVVMHNMKEKDRYDLVLEKVKDILDENDSIVNYALFKFFNDDEIVITNYFEQRELADDAKKAADKDYLIATEHSYSLNFEDPSIIQSVDAVKKLKRVLESMSSKLSLILTEEYKFRPIITNQRYWESILCSRMYY